MKWMKPPLNVVLVDHCIELELVFCNIDIKERTGYCSFLLLMWNLWFGAVYSYNIKLLSWGKYPTIWMRFWASEDTYFWMICHEIRIFLTRFILFVVTFQKTEFSRLRYFEGTVWICSVFLYLEEESKH